MERISKFLQERKQNNLFRVLQPANFRKAGRIYFKAKEFIDLSANDYLGLSRHPHLLTAAKKALAQYGVSASASRLLSGDLTIHHQLEEQLAVFKGKPKALVYNSGYQANLGIISALCRRGDVIFSDRLNHASIVDGILLSGARLFRFDHNDSGHLEFLLKRERNKFNQALIITETIFSMDGDKCPLKEISALKHRYNCRLLVDEAHATGVFGRSGAGLVEQEGLNQQVDLIMGTFSKALGSFGAYIAGDKKTIEYLINTSRGFIYSTALPPAVIAANIASLSLIKNQPFRRKTLLENARYLREELTNRGFQVKGCSQIVPLILGDVRQVIKLSRRLSRQGFWSLPIRPPTVPANEARLRFSLSYAHSKQTLNRLINVICAAGI
ncbi:8-amino-7-oxononanoate synthase [Candidatus Omnitrophota bacterium]